MPALAQSFRSLPKLIWLGLLDCSWLSRQTLLTIEAGSLFSVQHSLPAPVFSTPRYSDDHHPVEDWEELSICDDMCTLRLPKENQDDAPSLLSTNSSSNTSSERASRWPNAFCLVRHGKSRNHMQGLLTSY